MSADHRHEGASPSEANILDAYGVALVLVLLSVLLLIAGRASVLSAISLVAALSLMLALVVTLRVSGVRRRMWIALSVASIASLGIETALASTAPAMGEVLGIALLMVFTLSAIVAVFARLRSYRRVTFQLVLGLLVVYLLLGMSYSFAYMFVELVSGPAFSPGPQRASDLVYFSFVTLATLGYGDIAPVAGAARALAVSETILGQLYLVSIVSFAVGRMRSERAD